MLRQSKIQKFSIFWMLFSIVCVYGVFDENRNWGISKGPSYSCGLSYVSRIVGGTNAVPNEFPWMVALMRSAWGRPEKQFYCGGTIISRRYILTAAHCISPTLVTRITDITARVGAHNLQTGNSPFQRDFQIRHGSRHPRYSLRPIRNDISVLQTNAEITWSDGVGAICLPFQNRNNMFEYSIVTLTGWGAIGQTLSNSAILQKVQTMVQTNNWCNSWLQQQRNPLLDQSELCTYQRNRDSCSSDSGGPVLSIGTRKFLIGVISSGGVCGKSIGVNVRITAYLNWIKATVNRMDYETGIPFTGFEEYSM